MSSYTDFLATKQRAIQPEGRRVDPGSIHPMLHDWQAELTAWAVHTGRAALWEDTGLGKTIQQVEWARLSGDTALIVAPLAVCRQTVREAAKVDVDVAYLRDGIIPGRGVWITNYEQVHKFDPSQIGAVVLDEASILKNFTGKTRQMLIEHFSPVPHRLTCTATPAPNEPQELTSQAEFLGHGTRTNMLAAYFIHDDRGWRLKGHARNPMFRWMSTWAVALRRPSDIGYPDTGYVLPGLRIIPEYISVDLDVEGQLFPTDLGGVGGRARVRRDTLAARCGRAVELVEAESDEPWLLWAGLNDEANFLARSIPDAVTVDGSMSPEQKAEYLLGFAAGDFRVMVTKPSIASQGLNFQRCARMIFVGLSDSYEQYYQAIRRCYRYGQTRVVHAHVVLSELESQIAVNISRKEREAGIMTDELVAAMRAESTWKESA